MTAEIIDFRAKIANRINLHRQTQPAPETFALRDHFEFDLNAHLLWEMTQSGANRFQNDNSADVEAFIDAIETGLSFATKADVVQALREIGEGAEVVEGYVSYRLKGDRVLETNNNPHDWEQGGDWSIWDANNPTRIINSAEMEARLEERRTRILELEERKDTKEEKIDRFLSVKGLHAFQRELLSNKERGVVYFLK